MLATTTGLDDSEIQLLFFFVIQKSFSYKIEIKSFSKRPHLILASQVFTLNLFYETDKILNGLYITPSYWTEPTGEPTTERYNFCAEFATSTSFRYFNAIKFYIANIKIERTSDLCLFYLFIFSKRMVFI